MNYQIMQNRLNSILERDKSMDPIHTCQILKGEISPIIANYIELNHPIEIRYKKEQDSLKFEIEVSALRLKPIGYLSGHRLD